jgi:hypothetical protein
MKQTVNYYDFKKAFFMADRADQFSGRGLSALFDHLVEYEESSGEEMELDVVALCCDYIEYKSAIDACAQYTGFGCDIDLDDEDAEENALEWLIDRTYVVQFDGGIIISEF